MNREVFEDFDNANNDEPNLLTYKRDVPSSTSSLDQFNNFTIGVEKLNVMVEEISKLNIIVKEIGKLHIIVREISKFNGVLEEIKNAQQTIKEEMEVINEKKDEHVPKQMIGLFKSDIKHICPFYDEYMDRFCYVVILNNYNNIQKFINYFNLKKIESLYEYSYRLLNNYNDVDEFEFIISEEIYMETLSYAEIPLNINMSPDILKYMEIKMEYYHFDEVTQKIQICMKKDANRLICETIARNYNGIFNNNKLILTIKEFIQYLNGE